MKNQQNTIKARAAIRGMANLDAYETLVIVEDHRGAKGTDLYAVPRGTDNPQDAVKYRRVAYWTYWDSAQKDGGWELVGGEPSGVTVFNIAPHIGAAY